MSSLKTVGGDAVLYDPADGTEYLRWPADGSAGDLEALTTVDLSGHDLEDNGTTVWDSSKSHIPQSAVENGGDADTLDELDSSQFLRSDQNDSFTGSDLDLSNASRLRLPTVTSDPSNREAGDIWFRSDLS